MTDRAKMIFGNEISEQDYQKAEASKKKYIRKFGDDAEKDYPVFLRENAVIGPVMGVQDVVIGAPVYADAKSDSPDRAAVPKSRTETVNNGPETERKAYRRAEALEVTADRNREIDKAMKEWSRQIAQYAINVTDYASLQALKDYGVKEVEWVTRKDERVCRECRSLDGEIFQIDDVPAKPHYGCRCALVPVGKRDFIR